MHSPLTKKVSEEEMFRYHLYLKALCNSSRQIVSRNFSSNALPRLPVPPLKDTMTKFLRSVKPFLNEEEYCETQQKWKRFTDAEGIGSKLQHLLEKHAENKENWLADWWLKVAYLEFRAPVVYFSSPGLVFPKQTFNCPAARIHYAANLVSAAIDYKLKIDQNKIPQEMSGKSPLDMSQYKKVFGTCRIPCKPGDRLEFHPNSRHILVMHKNHMFKMDVIKEGGGAVSTEQLEKNLARVEAVSRRPADHPIGILTSDERDSWSDAYALLSKNADNVNSLQAIAESLFVLCLDSKDVTDVSEGRGRNGACADGAGADDMNVAGQQCMHGGGSRHNAGNRWYDKTIQFIIGEDGHVGLTYEHSPAEGQPIAVMADHIVNYISAKSGGAGEGSGGGSGFCAGGDAGGECLLEELEFCTSELIKPYIAKAVCNIDALVADCETACFKFVHYGKDFVKTLKLSPDSFLQMAMQYAFYRIHGEPGAHYESAATRMFAGGRTETIRSCSVESVQFAQTMLSCAASRAEKVRSLKAAVESHRNYTMQALQGLGVDRHLFGLKQIAQELGCQLPDIYTDEGYVRSLHMRLSTSQVALKSDGFMVYGPLVKDGYAVCYNPRNDDVNFGITAHANCAATSANNFRTALEQSLVDMQKLFATEAKL